MSFFDQPYYASTKAHMSRIGIWPEQSKYVRRIRLLTIFTLMMTMTGPVLIRLPHAWRDTHSLIHDLPTVMIGTTIFVGVLRSVQHFDKIKLSVKNIEEHWEMLKTTSAVLVLEKYAERGCYFIRVYSMYVYVLATVWLMSYLSPPILDFIHPLNETRPKMYIFINVEYGVDVDEYYWFVIAHQYIVVIAAIGMLLSFESMYLLWVIHACALFKVVGFNLKLVADTHPINKENASTPCIDWNYKRICYCIAIHEEAISFSDLIESVTSGIFSAGIFSVMSMLVFTSVQILLNLKRPDVLMQLVAYATGQVVHFYINVLPGQELINHSQQIHSIVYDLNWQDLSVESQKLLIPIMIRSNKPCYLTARKVYVLSMESFGSTIRSIVSYIMILAQLI